MNLTGFILAAESSEPASAGGGIGVGAAALSIAVVLLLAWMGFLYVNSRRTRAATQETAPPNLSQPISDDELENAKLTRVLRAALFGSILLAVALPWYAINEPDRQAEAADMFLEEDIEAGDSRVHRGQIRRRHGVGCSFAQRHLLPILRRRSEALGRVRQSRHTDAGQWA
jgi:hypothetical protein